MRKLILVLIFVFVLFGNVLAATQSRPVLGDLEMLNNISKQSYSWLLENEFCMNANFRGNVENFISWKELYNYIKLKVRGLTKEIKIYDVFDFQGCGEKNIIWVTIELERYNDSLNIYHGLIEFRAESVNRFSQRLNPDKEYRITNSIAGSDGQIKQLVKQELDYMIESFIQDRFAMEDLIK